MPDPFFGAGDPFFGANNPFFAANNRRNDAFQAAAASRAAAMANAAARGRDCAASITVLRSDEPVSVNTATLSASDGTQRTSMQTTTSGGFVSQTTTSFSSSSSSSSSSFNNNNNPNQQQQQQQESNDRVALGVATPTANVVFNVGPTLGEVGIRATGASTAASQGMSMNAYTVVDAGALAVSDGAVVEASANANGANASSPRAPRPVNVTVTSPAVDFTFAFAEGTTNASEGEGGATFVACIRLPASRNLSKVAIVAPAATVAMSFEPNQQQPTSTSVSRTGPSAPTEGAFITHTADVSVQLGGTVVEARRLFGLRYPAAWAADLTDEALQTAAPRCVRRKCNGNGADASSGGVACPADFVVPT